jgi:hypothetical protein
VSVAEEADLLRIDRQGRIIVAERARQRLLGQQGSYQIVPTAPGLVILQRVPAIDGSSTPGKVVMCGEIDRQAGLVDIIHFIHGNAWTGELNVVVGVTRKSLHFRRGDLEGAVSNLTEYHLGAVLYRHGILSEEELTAALEESAVDESKVARVLVDQGRLSPHDLQTYVRKQVEEIFFSVLALDAGDFYFYRTGEEGSKSQVHLSAKALLFEGVKRMDELPLYREKLPASDVILSRREPRPSESLTDLEQRVLEFVDGHLSLSSIARQTHLGEFETTRVLYRLVQSGWVQVVSRRAMTHQKPVTPSESALHGGQKNP